MSCERYEPSIVAYHLGELAAGDSAELFAHIETCERCRAAYEGYAGLVHAIEREFEISPTLCESESLSRALNQVVLRTKPASEHLPQGLPALIWASLAAFLVVASVLALQVLGCFSLANVIRAVGPAPIALVVVITVFVTSFLPIAVAARRRPLNGMTFRR